MSVSDWCGVWFTSALLLSACGPATSTDAGAGDANDTADATSDSTDEAVPADASPCTPSVVSSIDESMLGLLHVASDAGVATIADPSAFYPPGAPAGALSYSVVPTQATIRTSVAVSADNGAHWTFVGDVNAPMPATMSLTGVPGCAGGGCTGTIVNETSSILYDPTDPDPMRAWKIFTHRYVVVNVPMHGALPWYPYGHIAMFTAPAPRGPWSTPTVAAGWPSGTPFSSQGAAYSSTDDPGTAACLIFGEPGATVAPDNSLHLALGCATGALATPSFDIVLLRSTDHGASWHYVSTPLHGADGDCFGGAGRMNAADLFVAGGREYLMATPEPAQGRTGCVVYSFTDVAAGTIAPSPVRYLQPVIPAGQIEYAGACTFAEGASAMGFTMSRVHFELMPPEIHEIATGISAP